MLEPGATVEGGQLRLVCPAHLVAETDGVDVLAVDVDRWVVVERLLELVRVTNGRDREGRRVDAALEDERVADAAHRARRDDPLVHDLHGLGPTAPQGVEHALHVLLVDDDVRNIFALTSALELKGANVVIARNGREALDRVQADPPIDLVLMDVMMPEMDGFGFLRALRSRPDGDVPVVVLTTKEITAAEKASLGAAADRVISIAAASSGVRRRAGTTA